MRRELLQILCCPICQKGLELRVLKGNADEIVDGILLDSSDHIYPVIEGIPRMIHMAFREQSEWAKKYKEYVSKGKNTSVGPEDTQDPKTVASFGYEWNWYQRPRREE